MAWRAALASADGSASLPWLRDAKTKEESAAEHAAAKAQAKRGAAPPPLSAAALLDDLAAEVASSQTLSLNASARLAGQLRNGLAKGCRA